MKPVGSWSLVDSRDMWRRAGVCSFAAALAIAGCSGGSKRLAGRWHGTRAEGVPNESQAAADTFAGKMLIEVTGDVIVVTTGGAKLSGHYKTVREDKDKVVITTDKDGPTDEQTFTFVDAKTMRWSVVSGKAIFFAKDKD